MREIRNLFEGSMKRFIDKEDETNTIQEKKYRKDS
jgi:hypothetical protein